MNGHKHSRPGGTPGYRGSHAAASGAQGAAKHPQRAAVAQSLEQAHALVSAPGMASEPLMPSEQTALLGTAQTLTNAASTPAT